MKVLQRNADVIAQRLGFPLRLVRIADLDTARDRGVDLAGIRFDADAEGLIDDPDVEIVVELIGGYDAARQLILAAIERGKQVVTANKALLALHGKEIFDAAAGAGRGRRLRGERRRRHPDPALRCARGSPRTASRACTASSTAPPTSCSPRWSRAARPSTWC